MDIDIRHAIDPVRYERMTTAELRESFLIDNLFAEDEIPLTYSHVDRAVVASAVPVKGVLKLESNKKEFAAEYFTERREVGVINIGGSGTVTVDDETYSLDSRDALYIGKGSKEIIFKSNKPEDPARFYIVSYPAHTEYPTRLAKFSDAAPLNLGSMEESNKRTIYKYIHPEGIKSCQLVMGFTQLEPGSVWNTMPPHTHIRRSEVYMYFDLDENDAVFHLMGKPDQLKNIVIRDGQAVISPVWSVHSGAGTRAYSFVWAMGGENQAFDDMDFVQIADLK